MRRSAFLARFASVACLGGLAALEGCARRPAPAPRAQATPGRPVRIVALGDSLAFGTGASAPRNGFIFRAYLRVLERHPGSRIDDYAIPGSVAADVLRVQVPRLAQARADAVVVCVGGNDVVHRNGPAAFAATYARLVERVRALQPHAAIVLCGIPDVGLSPLFTGADHDEVAGLSRKDDATVRAIARRYGAAFVDLYAVTTHAHGSVNRFLSDDRFHPSDAGYAAFADALAPALLRAVEH
ncbi:MAG TPA: SGNH/GDSL hydrolase family protein [Candidatus Elarobacter sp.]|jgi:lysophospholipase L1-like esterase|nr:SGNH/GDSL hydrolase family protein [Candidatus Elarobacter sp.]